MTRWSRKKKHASDGESPHEPRPRIASPRVGYLRGPRLGAWTYNLVHTEALPVREVGMMHCYAGDLDLARRYRDLGFLISVPGPVTYANNTRGRGVAAEVPLDRLLVETEGAAHRAQVVRALRQHEAPRQALTSRIGRRQDDVLPLGGRSDGRTRRRTRPPSRAWRDGPVTSSTRPSPIIQTRRPSRRASRYSAPVLMSLPSCRAGGGEELAASEKHRPVPNGESNSRTVAPMPPAVATVPPARSNGHGRTRRAGDFMRQIADPDHRCATFDDLERALFPFGSA